MHTHKTNMLFSNKVHHLMLPLFGNVIDADKKVLFCQDLKCFNNQKETTMKVEHLKGN